MSNVNYKRAQRLCKTHIMIGVRQEHLTNINTEFRLKELQKCKQVTTIWHKVTKNCKQVITVSFTKKTTRTSYKYKYRVPSEGTSKKLQTSRHGFIYKENYK